jgi:hypothetical protein
MAQNLATLLRDELQEAEAELCIDGHIRHADEARALIGASIALDELDEKLINIMQVLGNLRERENNPAHTEFDNLNQIAKQEGIFRDSK